MRCLVRCKTTAARRIHTRFLQAARVLTTEITVYWISPVHPEILLHPWSTTNAVKVLPDAMGKRWILGHLRLRRRRPHSNKGKALRRRRYGVDLAVPINKGRSYRPAFVPFISSRYS